MRQIAGHATCSQSTAAARTWAMSHKLAETQCVCRCNSLLHAKLQVLTADLTQ